MTISHHEELEADLWVTLISHNCMHFWHSARAIALFPDKVSHWGEITWHQVYTSLITLPLTLSDLTLSLHILISQGASLWEGQIWGTFQRIL